ncbi:MAG: phage holin family protein [Proteobacteria bacterium]|nr:phage holin family protein [Pseudomonadota bacterium]
MTFLVRLLTNMVAILLIAYFLPAIMWVDSWWEALAAAFLLGVVNTILRPILIFFTLPLTLLTFGLFLLVINGLMLWLVAAFVKGFYVNGFWGSVLGAILLSIVSWLLASLLQSLKVGEKG